MSSQAVIKGILLACIVTVLSFVIAIEASAETLCQRSGNLKIAKHSKCPKGYSAVSLSSLGISSQLVGSEGAPGIQGVQGAKGEKGDRGDTGSTGLQGPKGDKGDTGSQEPAGATNPALWTVAKVTNAGLHFGSLENCLYRLSFIGNYRGIKLRVYPSAISDTHDPSDAAYNGKDADSVTAEFPVFNTSIYDLVTDLEGRGEISADTANPITNKYYELHGVIALRENQCAYARVCVDISLLVRDNSGNEIAYIDMNPSNFRVEEMCPADT